MKPLLNEDLKIVPIERAYTLPSAWYTDPAVLEMERHSIFHKNWQYVGSLDQLPETGCHFPAEIAGERIVVVRETEAQIRAFFNVCKHRGGPIAMEPGCSKTLSCKYHGWTYRLDGSLRGVPKFDRAELFDKKDYGLEPLDVKIWNRMIFVKAGTDATPFDAYVQGINETIAPVSLSEFKFCKRVTYTVNCNWKVYIDNYLEGYHIPHVHPELCDLLQFQDYKTEVYRYHSLQSSPIRATDAVYAAGTAYYYFVYPNFMLNILPDRLQMNSVIPAGTSKTLVYFDYYYPEQKAGYAQTMEADISYSDRVQMEDAGICEAVQRGLTSHAYHKGRYSVECEQGVYHFHSLLRRNLR